LTSTRLPSLPAAAGGTGTGAKWRRFVPLFTPWPAQARSNNGFSLDLLLPTTLS
jgi:hypothetical protein